MDTRSSYITNDFGTLLKNYVIIWKPVGLVELGVLDGYSTIAIAEGLRDIDRLYGVVTKIRAFDLFDDYAYKHGNMEEVQAKIDSAGLSKYVELAQGDAYKVWEQFEDEKVEMLHVDISNTGDTLRDIMQLWHPKLRERCIVCFEGGSQERDEIPWMKDFNKPPIKKELETNQLINDRYIYGVYMRYPSMTVMLKKWY